MPHAFRLIPDECYFSKSGHEALKGSKSFVFEPEILHLIFQAELFRNVREQAVVPLFRREILADGGQVEYRNAHTRRSEPRSRADHQGRFTHLTGGEDIAELTAHKAVVEFVVGLAGDVAGRIASQTPASNIEILGGYSHHVPFSSLLKFLFVN